MTPTPPPPTLYQLDLETLGYAIGQLLRHSSLRSNRSLANAARAFLTDASISLTALSEQEVKTFFYHVGRGHATKPFPGNSRNTAKETPHGNHDH